MKKEDIEALASMPDSKIKICKIVEHNSDCITFIVDKGLKAPKYHMQQYDSDSIVNLTIDEEQINGNLADLVKCSFENEKFSYLGKDTLYQCFVRCFAEHRPLVLTPDVIWLIICQTLTDHIYNHADEYREQIVNHEGKMLIDVESPFDLYDNRCDWELILDTFYEKIEQKTKNAIAQKVVADFSTTGINERVSSIATLMHGVESYFSYQVTHFVCGIPYITLKGNQNDWTHLLEKASVLKDFGLDYWYSWIEPILKEFARAASGKPHLKFWKNIVQVAHKKDFSAGRGCIPDWHDVNGWCVALFNHIDGETGEPAYEKCLNTTSMQSEIQRVGFKYRKVFPGGETVTPMELWCGIVGVEEDEDTYALTPKIGWFVRGSHEHEESLDRLNGAKDYHGIYLTVDEVPEILNELDDFNELTLRFRGEIKLPDWLFKKSINTLILFGKIDEEYSRLIKKSFDDVKINEEFYDYE